MIELFFLKDPSDDQKNQILSLYHERRWWPESITDAHRVQQVIDGSHCFVAAFSGQELAGMGRALSDRTGDAYIHDVTVREEFRNHGLGRRIIQSLTQRLKQDGITWVALIAEGGSHGFYEKTDFRIMENARPMYRWMI